MPTRTALAALAGSLSTLVIGALGGAWPATVVGGATLLSIVACFALTVSLGRRVRRERLEFAWWLGHAEPDAGGGAVVPGKPFEVRCLLRHRGPRLLAVRGIRPMAPGGATLTDPTLESGENALDLEPRSRTDFSFRAVAPAAGRVVFHGLAITVLGPCGLFEVPLYFPNPLVVRVLPRATLKVRSVARTITGRPVERSGVSLRQPGGTGTDLRELRQLRPGDSFKSIAWKASARRGQLLVREVEQEVQETRYVILDVSGTMRGGAPGQRKLDFAVEAAAAEARRALDVGDRIGLITVDGRMLSHVPPKDGKAQLLRIVEALLRATEAVDADLTEVDDDDVAALIARYLLRQDGVDFSEGSERQLNTSALLRYVTRELADAEPGPPIRASSPAGEVLRRFCLVRGIPLPYRPDPRDGSKGPGLAAALRAAGGRSRRPMSIFVITDGDAMGRWEGLRGEARLVRMHGHALVFVVPDALTFAPSPETQRERDVFHVYARAEQRHLAELRQQLTPLGVPVVSTQRDNSPALALSRAQNASKGRAA